LQVANIFDRTANVVPQQFGDLLTELRLMKHQRPYQELALVLDKQKALICN
jgi:hypothetical protein